MCLMGLYIWKNYSTVHLKVVSFTVCILCYTSIKIKKKKDVYLHKKNEGHGHTHTKC